MNSGCSIESLISVAAPYGSGNIPSPPTTLATYLIAMPTHDNIVPYEMFWDSSTSRSYPSCECTLDGNSCTNVEYFHLHGERLAGAIAKLRGYSGDIWGNAPAPSGHLNLINKDQAKCNEILDWCYSIRTWPDPNPYNEGWSCDNLVSDETDVIDYEVTSGGKVQLWRMNYHNHDYPNKRRSQAIGTGPTEFFMQLRIFFNNNRGRDKYPGYVIVISLFHQK